VSAVASSLIVHSSRGSSHVRKAAHALWCSHALAIKDHLKSVYDGDNVGKSDVKTEHMKCTKRCDKQLKGSRAMMLKKKHTR